MPGRAWIGVVLGFVVVASMTANFWRGDNCADYLAESVRGGGWCGSSFADHFGVVGPDNATIGGWAMLAALLVVLALLGGARLAWKMLSKARERE